MQRRKAFTLIEVLVTIVVISLILALVLPAVQAAREAARRLSCVNHLKQIGLAMANYEESNRSYPISGFSAISPSHFARILPYMEQGSLYNQINFDAHIRTSPGSANFTVAEVRLNSFLCPSDGDATSRQGWNSYAGNAGNGLRSEATNGAFTFAANYTPHAIGPSDFTDGLSGTAGCSEWLVGAAPMDRRDIRRSVLKLSNAALPATVTGLETACRGVEINGPGILYVTNDKGISFLAGGVSSLYDHILRVNERSCESAPPRSDPAISAGSFHPGGANVLFMDGRVRFIRDSIDVSILKGIGSRSGGEVVPSDPY